MQSDDAAIPAELSPETEIVPGPVHLDHDADRSEPLHVTDGNGARPDPAAIALLESRLAILERTVAPFALQRLRGRLAPPATGGQPLDLWHLACGTAALETRAAAYPELVGLPLRVTVAVRAASASGTGPPFTAPCWVRPRDASVAGIDDALTRYLEDIAGIWVVTVRHILGPWMRDAGLSDLVLLGGFSAGMLDAP